MALELNSMLNSINLLSVSAGSIVDDQWGIEGIYSQQFSVGIFFFLLGCIIFFTLIVIRFMSTGAKSGDGDGQSKAKGLKTGEKIMFFWIFVGIVGAVIMAVMQLLQGYLF